VTEDCKLNFTCTIVARTVGQKTSEYSLRQSLCHCEKSAGLSKKFAMYQQETDAKPAVLVGESRIFELISTGGPLQELLDRICSALDFQVGNVVSVALSLEEDAHSLNELAEQAVQFGLYVFSCCAILSKREQLLGTLETYNCLRRIPTVSQTRLILRASQLAGLAIERQDREDQPWNFTLPWKRAAQRNSPEGHLFRTEIGFRWDNSEQTH
jgi:GAF domain-containing protein